MKQVYEQWRASSPANMEVYLRIIISALLVSTKLCLPQGPQTWAHTIPNKSSCIKRGGSENAHLNCPGPDIRSVESPRDSGLHPRPLLYLILLRLVANTLFRCRWMYSWFPQKFRKLIETAAHQTSSINLRGNVFILLDLVIPNPWCHQTCHTSVHPKFCSLATF